MKNKHNKIFKWCDALEKLSRDFPGSPMAKTLSSQCREADQETKSHKLQLRACRPQLRPAAAK